MQRRRQKSPLPYLLLNIFISALTTLLVLWLWTRSQDSNLPAKIPLQNDAGSITIQATPTQITQDPAPLPPTDQLVVLIQNIFGVGDIENEVVVIQRVGDGGLSLNDWQLEDADGSVFTFNELVLNKDGSVQVYTRAGHDTVTELFWGLTNPIWQIGETAVIKDSQGNIRATYTIE
ncbi:MAG: lamin tail domain-containing protein [Anaerolineaceae bacterium]|nr:lamin tail domain-containing protein [Anaerolineaceae bacterium]